ncbi:hypothetical protein BDV38DRAFT_242322 [Aspergillus pseudotamarii]|uniref:Uncharacterized protein n=1 Tax=Aspergillus pseudotamarii TaxID=132259 RepID=A0A5N6SXG1_ASPPS|nr:uncharacterized protein BDV38DRAFT_242322 [Aspergillus pseudotamarii]KAE8139302.1 hypothetical protein BDV38DRAFT_242322 [Aspergillus pseudotamarii]
MDELLAHLPAHPYFQPHDILFVSFVHVQRFRPGHVCSFRRVCLSLSFSSPDFNVQNSFLFFVSCFIYFTFSWG